jgi:integrase
MNMATVRQRNGRWQAIVKRTGFPSQTRTFGLRRDALKWATAQERLLDTGEWQDATEARRTTMAALLDRYLREVTPHKRGAVPEQYRIAVLKRSTLAKFAPAAITSGMVASYRDARLQEVSPATVNRDLQVLRHVFNIAMQEWGIAIAINPVRLVARAREAGARDRVLTNQERQALLDACSQCLNPWVRPVVFFALETAARRGEILSLPWKAVDLTSCTAMVDGKTGPRTIPLSGPCVSMLKVLPRSINGQVFPVSKSALEQAFRRAAQRADVKNFTFHDIRHDSLTRLAKLGFSVLELRAISGHTSANMLQRYVSIDASDLAQKMAARA